MSVRSFFALVDLGIAVGGHVVNGVRWVQKKLAPQEPSQALSHRDVDHIQDQIRHATMHPPPPAQPPPLDRKPPES